MKVLRKMHIYFKKTLSCLDSTFPLFFFVVLNFKSLPIFLGLQSPVCIEPGRKLDMSSCEMPQIILNSIMSFIYMEAGAYGHIHAWKGYVSSQL